MESITIDLINNKNTPNKYKNIKYLSKSNQAWRKKPLGLEINLKKTFMSWWKFQHFPEKDCTKQNESTSVFLAGLEKHL